MSPHRKLSLVFAVAAALAVFAPSAASADTEVVKVRDACHVASFNDAVGPGTCVRDENRGSVVTFGEFLDAFPAGHGGWKFSSPITIDEGDRVVARMEQGGEFHTFTEVPRFGAGCVGLINDLMQLTGPPVVDCETALSPAAAGTFVAPDIPRTAPVTLTEGKHRFMCLIHPWMRTTVTVRED